MALYIDIHRDIESATSADVADAHRVDVERQSRFGVHFRGYWFAPASGTWFCLAEGPGPDAVQSVHRSSHGVLADEIFEVHGGIDDDRA